MSVKSTTHVQQYMDDVGAICDSLTELCVFVESLPAPDDDGTLPSLHYGHIAAVSELRKRIRDVEALAAEMWTSYGN